MSEVSNEVKQQIISEYIKTAAGRARLSDSRVRGGSPSSRGPGRPHAGCRGSVGAG